MKPAYFKRVIARCGLIVALAAVVFPCRVSAQVGDPIFPSALGPAIRIISPANHTVFFEPADVPILVYTRSEVIFSNVEFYANGQDLGPGVLLYSATNRPIAALASPAYMGVNALTRLHDVWGLVWSNAPAGSFSLTAVAKGLERFAPTEIAVTRTSAPVDITILATPPPTNTLPDVVNISAIDPIAVAGTNYSWVWPGSPVATPSWTGWPATASELFTNWGPKIALFTVGRYGSVSSDLTVNYSISGTASNGVDYYMLPGNVDIQAGYSRAFIPIVPIDHGTNTPPKTVILTLTPDTNVPPSYFVGFPPRAEAVIFESWPRPLPWLLPDGTFHFSATGPDGAWFSLESSLDLQNWTPVSTNQVIEGSIDFVDPNAPNNPGTFYQTVPVTTTPSD
jgi:hypothetical protein